MKMRTFNQWFNFMCHHPGESSSSANPHQSGSGANDAHGEFSGGSRARAASSASAKAKIAAIARSASLRDKEQGDEEELKVRRSYRFTRLFFCIFQYINVNIYFAFKII